MNVKYLAALGLAVAAVAVVIIFLFLPSPQAPSEAAPEQMPAAGATDAPQAGWSGTVDFPATPAAPASGAGGAATMLEEAWIEQLDALLTSDEDTSVTARKLVAAMPGLPAEAQEEFAAHAANLCDDEDFGLLENVYLTQGTPQEVLEVIFNDVLNRSDAIKLPLLAKTLRNPAHPMAGESKEILEMYLDIEPGSTAAVAWEQEVQKYLQSEAAQGQ